MHFIWHAFLDSIILFPFLLLAYILVELVETYTSKKINKQVLKSPYAPIFGAGLGLLPQCGFSVVATDLYSKQKITMGTLLAIYIATSDEAIPILLVSPSKIIYLLPLLLIKFFYALAIGFAVDGIYKHISKKKAIKAKKPKIAKTEQTAETPQPSAISSKEITASEIETTSVLTPATIKNDLPQNDLTQGENLEHLHTGCCGHHIEESKKEHWAKHYLLHPFIHALKIFAYILIINIIFGGLVEWIGENAITNFLQANAFITPLISVVVGLIPNCASSIILTQLFVSGGLSFGSLVAGLCVNAGLGLILLFKQNKNQKENITIVITLLVASLVIGYATELIMLAF